MNKLGVVFLAVLGIATISAPALADTSISFITVEGGRGGHPHRFSRHHPPPFPHHRPHHHARWHKHRSHYNFYPVIVTNQPYMYAPSPVVYETTVVRPAPRYVVDSSLVAEPTSPTYTDAQGRYCREYQSTGTVGGGRGALYGTACLQPDGAWRVVD